MRSHLAATRRAQSPLLPRLDGELGRRFWPGAHEYKCEQLPPGSSGRRSSERWRTERDGLHPHLYRTMREVMGGKGLAREVPPSPGRLMEVLRGEGNSALHSQLERWGFRLEAPGKHTLTVGQPDVPNFARVAVTVDAVRMRVEYALVLDRDSWRQTFELSRDALRQTENELTRISR